MSGSAATEPPVGAVPSGPGPARVRRSRGETITLRCGPMVHGGVCLAVTDAGDTVLVDGAIPGEVCEVVLSFRKGGQWFASVSAVLEPSSHRVAPPCPYFGVCGGCQLQHLDYAHQLTLKGEIVRDAMRRARVEVPDEMPVHGMAEPWSYRWRGEFHVVPGRRGTVDAGLGFNRLRSWTPVAVDDCLIHHPTIRGALPLLREAVRRQATPALTTLHLTVGDGGEELLVRPRPRAALPDLALETLAADAPAGLRLGTDSTTLRWRGHVFRARPESFIQVNWMQMDVLYSLALDALGQTARGLVVDAYAGIGVLSVAIAERARTVVCIEENPVAVRMGILNARLNDVAHRLRWVARPVEEALAEAALGADAVVLDPPRAGCLPSVVGWLALAGPPLVVYISCDPATLARDLRVLTGPGPYTVERLDLVDMFAQTHHIESVAVLRRR